MQAIDETFEKVVMTAKDILRREIDRAKRITEDGKIVEEIYNKAEDKRIIVLDKHYAWGRVLAEKPEPLMVVYPDTNGGPWRAKCVRSDPNSFVCRQLFPEDWAGKTGEELAKASGVEDALFCHNHRFTVSAKTKEGAIALAKLVLNS